MCWSEWLYTRIGRTNSIALVRLTELLFEYLVGKLKLEPKEVAATLWADYQRGGRRDKPGFLKDHLPIESMPKAHKVFSELPKRQARHLV